MSKPKYSNDKIPMFIDFDEMGEEKVQHIRKILKNYSELNKLMDLCLKKIEVRAEVKKK
jgi:hypothetical protein